MTKNIWFDKNLLRSTAFRSLKKWSLLVYLDFLRKRQMEAVKRTKRSDDWIIKNNGDIVYPYAEAENKGIGRREFRNAIDELIAKGFIDINHQGSGGRSGDMTRYFIAERWKDYGSADFRQPQKARIKDRRPGRGWSAYHAKKEKESVTELSPGEAYSSNKSVNRKKSVKKRSVYNNNEKRGPMQLVLWSNNSDTIL